MNNLDSATTRNKPTFSCEEAMAGDAFVGLKYEENELKIVYPMGYRLNEDNGIENEKQGRKDVLNLISVLSSFGKNNTKGYYGQESNEIKEENTFPIHGF